jgi:putative transposase
MTHLFRLNGAAAPVSVRRKEWGTRWGGWPRECAEWGIPAEIARLYTGRMPQHLKRIYGKGHLHFITCSCYEQRPNLGTAERRDLFVALLEELRSRLGFRVVGYVVMPEHFHLLMEEHETVTPSTVLQSLKQRFARRVESQGLVWQTRFYDFNVWSSSKIEEKLGYMHLNPVRRGLVVAPEDWAWSSARFYAGVSDGVVTAEPVSTRRIALYTGSSDR